MLAGLNPVFGKGDGPSCGCCTQDSALSVESQLGVQHGLRRRTKKEFI